MARNPSSSSHDDDVAAVAAAAAAVGEGGSSSPSTAADSTTNKDVPSPTDSADAAAEPTSAAATVKQTRASLSIHEKSIVKSFCEQRVDESKARGEVVPSQDLLRREVQSKFGWEMGRSTLSKIMTMDWKALSPGVHRNPNMKRKRKPLFPDFEADLVKYIGVHVAQHEARAAAVAAAEMSVAVGNGGSSAMLQAPFADEKSELASNKLVTLQQVKRTSVLTEAVILEEAQRLKKVHGIRDEELVLSVGWLARFKHRNGIRLRKGAASNGKQQAHLTHVSHAPASVGFSASGLVSPSDLLFENVASVIPTAAAPVPAAAAVLAVEEAPAPSPFLEAPEKADPVEAANLLLLPETRVPMSLPKDGEGRAALFRALVAGDEDRSALRRRRASF